MIFCSLYFIVCFTISAVRFLQVCPTLCHLTWKHYCDRSGLAFDKNLAQLLYTDSLVDVYLNDILLGMFIGA